MSHRHKTAVLISVGLGGLAAAAQAQGGRTLSFSSDVQPILQQRCAACHGRAKQGGLKVDTLADLMSGGRRGPVVVPGDPTRSRLVQVLDGRAQPKMPPRGAPLSQAQIAAIAAWIQQGAKDAADPVTSRPQQPFSTVPDGEGKADKPLEIVTPKDGATVREKVLITIPRASIPQNGFVGIYVDKNFRAAVPLPDEEELKASKKPLDSPLTYVWDTHQPITDRVTTALEDRFAADGIHEIEVQSHDSTSKLVESVRIKVNLRNQFVVKPNDRFRLAYAGRMGKGFFLEHTVDIDASAPQVGGFGGSVQGVPSATGGEKFTHIEVAKYLLSLEDLEAGRGVGTGFWRERRESPMSITVNGVKSTIRADASSRYYSLRTTGEAVRSKAMERERREPVLNPIQVPPIPLPLSAPFNSTVRINLGAYIPGAVVLERVKAVIEGLETREGERCAKVKATYQSGTTKVDINSIGIRGADFEISQGTTTVWLSLQTNRVIKAVHDVTGTLVVDTEAAQSFGGVGGPGGELGPGGGGFGAPFGGPGGPGGGGMMPGMQMGGGMAAGGMMPGMQMGGGMRPGMQMGGGMGGGMAAGGMMPGGMMEGGMMGGGMMGGFGGPPSSQAELTGLVSSKRRYHVKLKVGTQLVKEPSGTVRR
jgi:cytochrome c553